MRVFQGREDILASVGERLGPSEWLLVDQPAIDAFADVTRDHQWIHVDVERAQAGPFGATIAHGFLTLALVPAMVAELRRFDGIDRGINSGLDKVRFLTPVRAGSRIRAVAELAEVDPIGDDGLRVLTHITVEVEGSDKPAIVVDQLSRYYF